MDEVTTLMLAEFDAKTRFKLRSARGSGQAQEGPALLERVAQERREATRCYLLGWSAAKRMVLPKRKPSSQTISLRLPEHLLDHIKAAAHAPDVPYPSPINVWQ